MMSVSKRFELRCGLMLAITAAALSLMACSGGGGGGDSGGSTSNNVFTVRLAQSSVSFDYVQGSAPAAQMVTATWTGTPPEPLYLGALLQGTGLSSVIPLQLTQTNATATLQPQAGLAAGQYSGQVMFLVCTDSACTQRVGGSPIPIAYTINVRAPLFSGPPDIALAHVRWTVPIAGVNLAVSANAGAWTASANQPWISLSQTSGSGAATVIVSVNGAALSSPGTFNGTVTLASPLGTQSSNVRVTVVQPTINASPVLIGGVNGAPLAAQSSIVSASLPGNAPVTLPMSATTSTPWLTINSAAPTVSNVISGSVLVTANPAVGPLASGTHTGNLRLRLGTATDFTNVDVNVSLGLSKATFAFSPGAVVLGGSLGRTFTSVPFNISLNTGTNNYAWSATGGAAWESLDRTSGTVGATSQTLVMTPNRLQSTPGTATSSITFSTQINGDTVTQALPVSFNLDTHRLIAAETGVALVDLPVNTWDILARSVKIRDNFGLSTPWAAVSSAAWLQATTSGIAGDDLVLTANTTGLALDQYYEATVTVSSTDSTVSGPERIRVGLWMGSTTPSNTREITATSANIQATAGDVIRPYVYIYEFGTTVVRVINAYTGTELAPITGLPSSFGLLSSMFVSQDGEILYLWNANTHVYVPVNLRTRVVGAAIASNILYSASFSRFFHLRPNGVGLLFNNQGEAQLESGGPDLAAGYFGNFGASGDSQRIFNSGIDRIDFTSAGGGIFVRTLVGSISGYSIAAAQSSNFDGSRVYAINVDSTQVLVANGLTGGLSSTISSGLTYRNMMVTRYGRVLVTAFATVGGISQLHVFDSDNVERLAPVDVGYSSSTHQGVIGATGDGHFAAVLALTPNSAVYIVPLTP